VDPRLAAALASQVEQWRATLSEGAMPIGWKLGLGEGERIGRGPGIAGRFTRLAAEMADKVAPDAPRPPRTTR